MNGTIKFVIPNDRPVAAGTTLGASAIAAWLSNDLQYLVTNVDWWLQVLSDLSSGKRKRGYQGTGNSFSVWATDKAVFIESEYADEEKACIATEYLTNALVLYMAFLKSDYQSPGFVATPFEVQY